MTNGDRAADRRAGGRGVPERPSGPGVGRKPGPRWAALVFTAVACADGTGPSPSGSLELSGCAIPEGEASCDGRISWTTVDVARPRLVIGPDTVSVDPSGDRAVTLGFDPVPGVLLDDALVLAEVTLSARCVSASAREGDACVAFAERLDERASTPFVEAGQPVSLEVVLFRPLGEGPFPTVVFHHGSTGDGSDAALFTVTSVSETVARFFADRGWMVAYPQRRGRGASDGLYDEGFTPDRSRYSCLPGPALAGLDRALEDADVVLDWVRAREDVDPSRVLVAGQSRGGALAVAHLGGRSEDLLGAVNFVGGWLGEGCADALAVNRTAFERGAGSRRPTLWLYGANDSFYSLAHSRSVFLAFTVAGGLGTYASYMRAPGLNGHLLINDVGLWTGALEGFVAEVGGG